MIDKKNKDKKSRGSKSSPSSFLRVVENKKDIPQKISLGVPTVGITPDKSGSFWNRYDNIARYDNIESRYNKNFYWHDYGSAMINYTRHIDFSTLRDKKSILKKGIVRVKELITSLNIPKRVCIVVNRNEIADDETMRNTIDLDNLSGCSVLSRKNKKDCIKLFLQTSVLDSKKPTEDKINIITSEGIHECAHILFSSNRIFFDFRRNLTKILWRLFNESTKTYSQSSKLSTIFSYFKELSYCYKGDFSITHVDIPRDIYQLLTNLEHSIEDGKYDDAFKVNSNVYRELSILRLINLVQYVITLSSLIEDKRVEKLLLKDRSGLEDYLRILTDFRYDELDDLDCSILKDPTTEPSILIKDVLKYILNPEKLEELGELNSQENKELLVSLSEILNKESHNSYESCLIALSIYEKLNEHLCKRFESPVILQFSGKLNTNLEGSLISSSQTVNSESVIDQAKEVSNNIKGTSSFTATITSGFISSMNSGNVYCKEFMGTLTTSIEKTMSDDVRDSAGELINGILNEDILEDEVDSNEVYFYKIDRENTSKKEYSRKFNQMLMLQKTVASFSSVLRKNILSKFKNQKISIYGCKTGTLNPARIVEAYQGVESVYTQPAFVETARVVLTLLIDESGSMIDCNRIDTVKKAAILLVNAFGNDDNIDLYIYGHTACVLSDRSTDILVYKEGSKKGDGIMNDLIALSNIQAREENMDSHAIYSVVKRVDSLAYPKGADKGDKKHIFIIMSDGSPYTPCFNGVRAIRDVREKVSEAQEEFGVDIIQCSIANIEDSNRMFDTVIELQNDLSNFVPNLSRVINDLLTKKIETKIKRF